MSTNIGTSKLGAAWPPSSGSALFARDGGGDPGGGEAGGGVPPDPEADLAIDSGSESFGSVVVDSEADSKRPSVCTSGPRSAIRNPRNNAELETADYGKARLC